MPNANTSLERKITSLLERLRSVDNISEEAARHLLWSVLETAPEQWDTSSTLPMGSHKPEDADQGTRTPTRQQAANGLDNQSWMKAQYPSESEDQWPQVIKAVPSRDPSELCFEVVVACPTSECAEKVIEIARSASLHTSPLDRSSRRQRPAKEADLKEAAQDRFAIPAGPDSSIGRVHLSEHELVFFIRDHYPLERLLDRLPWPPPNPLLHHWMEDFEYLDAWFLENQILLAGLGWDALWLTRHGRLTLPTWPLYALQGTRPGLRPSDLHALRDDFFFAAGVTKDKTVDSKPRPATGLRAESLETGLLGDTGRMEITGEVSKRARPTRSRKPRQAIVAATAAISIFAITIVSTMKWGKQQAVSENESHTSHSQSNVQPDTTSEFPTHAATRLQAKAHTGLETDATEGQGTELLSPSAALLEPETLATAIPQMDTDFFQNFITADFFPIAEPETWEATGIRDTVIRNVLRSDAEDSPQQHTVAPHTVARPELHDSQETLPTVTSQTSADDRAQIIEDVRTVREPLDNGNLTGEVPEQAVPMTVPAIPLRVQIEPQQHQWQLAFSSSLASFRPQNTLGLYETSEIVLQEMPRDERTEANPHSLDRTINASGSQHTLYWNWLIPIDGAVGRSHRGLIEFALEKQTLERVRVRLDLQVGKDVELTSASVATWDGGRSWYALSLDKIRETREQLTNRTRHIDHAIAQAKTAYDFASSTDERALIRTHRKTLEASEQMVETLDARLSELEKLVALLELHAAFVLVVQTDTPSVAKVTTPAGRKVSQILFQSTLAPTTEPLMNEK